MGFHIPRVYSAKTKERISNHHKSFLTVKLISHQLKVKKDVFFFPPGSLPVAWCSHQLKWALGSTVASRMSHIEVMRSSYP